jgi:hypothetical protein
VHTRRSGPANPTVRLDRVVLVAIYQKCQGLDLSPQLQLLALSLFSVFVRHNSLPKVAHPLGVACKQDCSEISSFGDGLASICLLYPRHDTLTYDGLCSAAHLSVYLSNMLGSHWPDSTSQYLLRHHPHRSQRLRQDMPVLSWSLGPHNSCYDDLGKAIGCGTGSPIKDCCCQGDMASSASSYLTACVGSRCAKASTGNVNTEVLSAVSMHAAYCATPTIRDVVQITTAAASTDTASRTSHATSLSTAIEMCSASATTSASGNNSSSNQSLGRSDMIALGVG